LKDNSRHFYYMNLSKNSTWGMLEPSAQNSHYFKNEKRQRKSRGSNYNELAKAQSGQQLICHSMMFSTKQSTFKFNQNVKVFISKVS